MLMSTNHISRTAEAIVV